MYGTSDVEGGFAATDVDEERLTSRSNLDLELFAPEELKAGLGSRWKGRRMLMKAAKA